jgi:hypothetical protein
MLGHAGPNQPMLTYNFFKLAWLRLGLDEYSDTLISMYNLAVTSNG